jgi:hypothetical protein
MVLYVSNPSRQMVVFYYRTKITNDNSGPAVREIPSGAQIELGHGWSRDEIEYVIEQIERTGGISAAEAHGRLGARVTGLVYREDHPVDEDEITAANASLEKAGEERSVKQATRGALAFDRAANTSKGRTKERLARVTQVEVIEELEPHRHKTGDEVSFKMTVDPDGRSDIDLPV